MSQVLETPLVCLFFASAGGIVLLFGIYPLLVAWAGMRAARGAPRRTPLPRRVSFLIVARNAEDLVSKKLANTLALEHTAELEVVFVSDGSSDQTVERARACGDARVRVFTLEEHRGKAYALNYGAERCTGEILVLSDADALLEPQALEALLAPFADAGVGGVCGQRVIGEEGAELQAAQARYIHADSLVKRAESRLGNVSSNDGKLYAVRRALHRPIAAGATDDLYACLSIIEQGFRFVFEPRARVHIRTPSRSSTHELARRRRIVARSLTGIAAKRALLNPLRHGAFALQLLVNKVCRRCLPLFLAGLFASSLLLAPHYLWARVSLALQSGFYLLALAHCARGLRAWPLIGPAAATAFYFCIGNLGTLLGLADFLRGRETVKWDPQKTG